MEQNPKGDTPEAGQQSQNVTDSAKDTPPKESVEDRLAALENDLQREKARAATAQKEQDRLRKELLASKRNAQPAEEGEPVQPVVEKNSNQTTANNRAELERGIYKMILDNPEFKEALESDPVLKFSFEKDPLILTDSPVDAQDALYQIKRAFEDKVYDKKKASLEKLEKENAGEELKTTTSVNPPGKNSGMMAADEMAKLSPDEQNKIFANSFNKWAGQ